MESSSSLWQNYHAAVRTGNVTLAKQILQNLKTRRVAASMTPIRNQQTCVKCRRSMTRG